MRAGHFLPYPETGILEGLGMVKTGVFRPKRSKTNYTIPPPYL